MKNLPWAFTNMCDLYGKTTRVLTAINFLTENPLILLSIFGCSQIKQRKLEAFNFRYTKLWELSLQDTQDRV